MITNQVFNLQKWIAENKHLLVPPVANQTIYSGNDDFIVMIVGGPNNRNDFHVNQGEELFYQLEGQISVFVHLDSGKIVEHKMAAGDMMLLPANVPHSPRRTEGSIGLVIERYRKAGEKDGFVWYCEKCENTLYEHYELITDIVSQLPPIMNHFQNDVNLRTCKNCGTIATLPKNNNSGN
jgi:3-hydroxyanthranilate 3,4-dioxygenase